MNRETMTKIFSTTLSVALVATSAPVPVSAAGPMPAAPSFVAGLTPPERFGYVASSYAPNGEDKPRLIVIADLHGHMQVQRHIMGMLENFVGALRKPGTVSANKQIPIFVEGGWEPGLEEPLRMIKEPAVRSFMSEYFLQKAEINASQAYSEKVAGSGQVTLIGAETKEEYLANKARFVKTYPARKELLLSLQREEAALRVIEEQVSGRTFKRLQSMRDDYDSGRVSPETYARALFHVAKRHGITGKQVDVLSRASSATTTELEIALSEVYRDVAHAVAGQKPFDTSFLRESLQNEDNIRQNLARIDASFDLLKRLIGNQLTPAEVPLALARMPELVSVAQMLLEKSPLKDKAADIVRESFDFYPFAMVRNDSLTDNSLKALERFGSDATGILVAGGFHTDAIIDRLRAKHVPYLLVNPVVSRDLSGAEQLNYVKRVCDDHVTADELRKDIDSLRHGGAKRLAEAAMGPVTDMDSQKGPGEQSMFGGIANPVAAAQHLAVDAVALENLMRSQEAVVAGAASVEAIGMSEAAAQLADVMGDRFEDVADHLQWTQSISLDRQLDGSYNARGGMSKSQAQTLANVINAVVGATEGGKTNAASIDAVRMVAVSDDVAIHALGAYGKIYWNEDKGDRSRTIVLGQTQFALVKHTLDQLDKVQKGSKEEAALQFALHNFVHELVHAFDSQGKSETSTIMKGIAITAGIIASHAAGEAEARSAVARFVSLIAGKLANSKEEDARWIGEALPGLTEVIASIFVTQGLSAESVQQVVDLLAKNHPEQPRYNIQQVVTSEAASVKGRIALAMSTDGDKVPPEVIKKANRKLDEADKSTLPIWLSQ